MHFLCNDNDTTDGNLSSNFGIEFHQRSTFAFNEWIHADKLLKRSAICNRIVCYSASSDTQTNVQNFQANEANFGLTNWNNVMSSCYVYFANTQVVCDCLYAKHTSECVNRSSGWWRKKITRRQTLAK